MHKQLVKRQSLTMLMLLYVALLLQAQIPVNYYSSVQRDKKARALRQPFIKRSLHTPHSLTRLYGKPTRKQTFAQTARFGICTQMLPTTSPEVQHKEPTIKVKAIATTASTHSLKVGLMMRHPCIPTYSTFTLPMDTLTIDAVTTHLVKQTAKPTHQQMDFQS